MSAFHCTEGTPGDNLTLEFWSLQKSSREELEKKEQFGVRKKAAQLCVEFVSFCFVFRNCKCGCLGHRNGMVKLNESRKETNLLAPSN